MSFFSKLFGSGAQEAPKPKERPEVKESDFVDTTDPNGEEETPSNIVTIKYGTDRPIDAIYAYMMRDWEEKGKQDALENSDIEHMKSKQQLILDNLRHELDLTRLNYDIKISQLKTKRNQALTLGLIGCVEDIDNEIAICNGHLDKMKEIEAELDAPKTHLKSMLDSYQRGFANGVAIRINETIHSNNRS